LGDGFLDLYEADDDLDGRGSEVGVGHPMRWAMVRELAQAVGRADGADTGTVPVSEMAARLGTRRPAVENHLPQMLAAEVVAV